MGYIAKTELVFARKKSWMADNQFLLFPIVKALSFSSGHLIITPVSVNLDATYLEEYPSRILAFVSIAKNFVELVYGVT